jgi:filamentous hemagglutinin
MLIVPGEAEVAAGLGMEAAAEAAAGVGARSVTIDGVDLSLTYKSGWTDAQRAAADAKVKILNDSDTVLTMPVRSGTSAASRYRQAGNTVPAGSDVDHMVDLQLGGNDTISNMSPLDMSVNRSLGAQIFQQTKGLQPGTKINNVKIGD